MNYTWMQYDNVIDDGQNKLLIDAAHKIGFEDARIADQNIPEYVDTDVRNCQVSNIPFKTFLWLESLLTEGIRQINLTNYKFDLEGFSDLQLIEYKPGSFFKRHLDNFMGEPDYQRKLTFIIQLSSPDDYVGGDLIVYTHHDEERMTRKKNSMIIFPSYTMHEVKELMVGTRYSLIGWVLGPEFK